MTSLAVDPLRPPVKYYGSKTRLAPWILSMVPDHRVWVEGCCGSAVVTLAKRPARFEFLNDRSDDLVTFLQVLRDAPDELARVCMLTPYARSEWAAATLDGDLADLERARRVWVRLQQSFGQTLSPRTGWAWSTARSQAAPATSKSMVGRFGRVAERLTHAVIECRPVVELLESMVPRLGEGDVVYLDPPYPHETRQTTGGAGYQVEMTEADHVEMATAARRLKSLVLVSSYHSELYEDLFDGWWSVERATRTSMSNASKTTRGDRVEVLWSNRPLNVPQMELEFQ